VNDVTFLIISLVIRGERDARVAIFLSKSVLFLWKEEITLSKDPDSGGLTLRYRFSAPADSNGRLHKWPVPTPNWPVAQLAI
jgi:hypothetical protein